MRKILLDFVFVLMCSFVFGHPQSTAEQGRVRTYYIAADEVDWDYAPSGKDLIHGEKYHFEADQASKGTLNPNATVYRKAVFREYTDANFRTLKPRSDAWAHLGILGPLIRAEVGDTIKVVFRNNASHRFTVHPHGVFYAKDSEGAAYEDSTTNRDKADDSIAPGGTYTYTWLVPERAGPTEGEGSSAFWVYHSHVDEGRDINSGLIGPIIVTRRGMARDDASPKDVDREFIVQFGLYDEHLSWYWETNLKQLYGDPKNYNGNDTHVHDFHHFYTLNGYLDGNGPMMMMRKGERVRWYVFANPNEQEAWDIHTAHWHGQTAVVGHMRTDMIMLTPMMSAVADMMPDNPGIWLLHCHMPGHFGAGDADPVSGATVNRTASRSCGISRIILARLDSVNADHCRNQAIDGAHDRVNGSMSDIGILQQLQRRATILQS